jgi:ribosomal protein S18 acetylase RimI-like enzyme
VPQAFGASHEDEARQPLGFFGDRLASSAVFGALLDARLVGIAGFYRQAGVKARHKGVLWGMYVQPSARGAGIARRLVEAVTAYARRHVEILLLTVVNDNQPARRLYASAGFVEYGIERRSLKVGDVYFDEVLMAKAL